MLEGFLWAGAGERQRGLNPSTAQTWDSSMGSPTPGVCFQAVSWSVQTSGLKPTLIWRQRSLGKRKMNFFFPPEETKNDE